MKFGFGMQILNFLIALLIVQDVSGGSFWNPCVAKRKISSNSSDMIPTRNRTAGKEYHMEEKLPEQLVAKSFFQHKKKSIKVVNVKYLLVNVKQNK